MFYRLKLSTEKKKYTGIKNKGSFFVELLIYMVIIMMLVPPVIEMMNQSLNSFFHKRDIAIMHARYRTAVSMISGHIFYCGAGMPSLPSEFNKAFQNSVKTPFLWETPLSVSEGGKELRILYARPQGKTVTGFTHRASTDEQILTLSTPIDSNRIITVPSGAPHNIKNIILIPSMYPSRVPFIVRGVYRGNQNRYIVESYISPDYFIIPNGAEIYLLYACRVFCDTTNSVFRTQDYRLNGAQPKVRGIEDICFIFDKEHKTLEIYFLVRGKFKYSNTQPVLNSELWPSGIESLPLRSSSNYKRRVFKYVSEVPNFE